MPALFFSLTRVRRVACLFRAWFGDDRVVVWPRFGKITIARRGAEFSSLTRTLGLGIYPGLRCVATLGVATFPKTDACCGPTGAIPRDVSNPYLELDASSSSCGGPGSDTRVAHSA